MFERPRHRQVERLLGALDARLLHGHRCLFGGGTAMTMRGGEYRESADVDFLVSHLPGYRALRQLLTGAHGIDAITSPPGALRPAREVRADQYGIRTWLYAPAAGPSAESGEGPVKFEIVFEARIELEPPGDADLIGGVATLSPIDMLAEKLLALSDRWRDDSACARDLIDLAMASPRKAVLHLALDKARGAYGASIDRDLRAAVEGLRDRPARLEACMARLAMDGTPRALLWSRIKALVRAAGAAS